jgi:hypothetical protein
MLRYLPGNRAPSFIGFKERLDLRQNLHAVSGGRGSSPGSPKLAVLIAGEGGAEAATRMAESLASSTAAGSAIAELPTDHQDSKMKLESARL